MLLASAVPVSVRTFVIGDAIANGAAVGRERGDARGNRRRRIDGHAQRGRGHAGIAGRIGRRRGQAVGAIGERRGGEAPGPCPARNRAAEQRGAIIDLDGAVGFRRTGQRQRIVVGDVVANGAAVGRERGNARGDRGGRVDGHAQGAEATPVLPAASVAVAVRLWAPLASAAVV